MKSISYCRFQYQYFENRREYYLSSGGLSPFIHPPVAEYSVLALGYSWVLVGYLERTLALYGPHTPLTNIRSGLYGLLLAKHDSGGVNFVHLHNMAGTRARYNRQTMLGLIEGRHFIGDLPILIEPCCDCSQPTSITGSEMSNQPGAGDLQCSRINQGAANWSAFD